MKNDLLTILIMLFVLPAVAPMLSHGSIHVLHNHHASHHGGKHHDHSHHEHKEQAQAEVHHVAYFDIMTFFSDYLHVDLKSPQQSVLKAPALDTYDIYYTIPATINPMPHYELASVQSRAPPNAGRLRPDKTPLYLSTQRLRI